MNKWLMKYRRSVTYTVAALLFASSLYHYVRGDHDSATAMFVLAVVNLIMAQD